DSRNASAWRTPRRSRTRILQSPADGHGTGADRGRGASTRRIVVCSQSETSIVPGTARADPRHGSKRDHEDAKTRRHEDDTKKNRRFAPLLSQFFDVRGEQFAQAAEA